jgi:hypothetical protein
MPNTQSRTNVPFLQRRESIDNFTTGRFNTTSFQHNLLLGNLNSAGSNTIIDGNQNIVSDIGGGLVIGNNNNVQSTGIIIGSGNTVSTNGDVFLFGVNGMSITQSVQNVYMFSEGPSPTQSGVYFNQDIFLGPGVSLNGLETGYYLSAYDTTTQTNPGATFANAMTFNSIAESKGIYITASSRVTFEYDGVYNIQFSAQVEKTDSGNDEIEIWLSKNGLNVDWSNTTLELSGNNVELVAAWNFVSSFNAGDYFELYWHSNDIDMRILTRGTQSNPDRPAIPSIILTAQQVSGILTGPEGPQGPAGTSQASAMSSLFVQTDDKTIQNTTTITSAFGTGTGSRTIDANTLQVGSRYEMEFYGYYRAGITQSLDYTINMFGATAGFGPNVVPLVPQQATDFAFKANFSATVRSLGATGQSYYNGCVEFNNGSGDNVMWPLLCRLPITINTTTASTFEFDVQWSSATSSNKLVITNASIQKIR